MDLLYTPRQSRLLREAAAAGASAFQNGDVMLINQSAAAFESLLAGSPTGFLKSIVAPGEMLA